MESPNSDISWSVCWGGAAYTGSTTGVISNNEFDGEFGPCFSGPLPSAGTAALQFTGPATAPSTNNQADYRGIGVPSFRNLGSSVFPTS